MLSNSQDQKITLTIRLEPQLALRLRGVRYYRLKKQRVMRDAMAEYMDVWNRASARKRRIILEDLQRGQVTESKSVTESIRLETELHEALNTFALDQGVSKQAVVRQALIEFLDRFEASGNPLTR